MVIILIKSFYATGVLMSKIVTLEPRGCSDARNFPRFYGHAPVSCNNYAVRAPLFWGQWEYALERLKTSARVKITIKFCDASFAFESQIQR
jgi:hypothetical protein